MWCVAHKKLQYFSLAYPYWVGSGYKSTDMLRVGSGQENFGSCRVGLGHKKWPMSNSAVISQFFQHFHNPLMWFCSFISKSWLLLSVNFRSPSYDDNVDVFLCVFYRRKSRPQETAANPHNGVSSLLYVSYMLPACITMDNIKLYLTVRTYRLYIQMNASCTVLRIYLFIYLFIYFRV